MKPMLAGKAPADLSKIHYPALCTPKLDGIRCLLHPDLGPVTRTLNPIPNVYIREQLSRFQGLDGEIMIPGATCFGDVNSAVMRRSGEPSFVYWVFDLVLGPSIRYDTRALTLHNMGELQQLPEWMHLLLPVSLNNPDQLEAYEQKCLAEGYEGVMIRTPGGPYKFGRSTTKEGYLLKLKRFEQSEAIIVAVEEQMHNDNEQTKDALGHAKRSSAKAGKRPAGVLGKLICYVLAPGKYDQCCLLEAAKKHGVKVRIGSGFTAAQREELWRQRDELQGLIVTFKHQAYGVKDAPRSPIFKGFRSTLDLGGE